MRLPLRAVACASALFFVASVWADGVIEKPVKADTPEKFAETSEQVRQEMDAGGRYEYIKAEERAKAEVDLNTMAALLKKSGSVDKMTQVEKVQLFNTQEHLNGILTHSDSNRLICEHRAPVGTSIPRTTCQTYGEVEQNRKDSNKTLTDAALVGSRCANASCRGN